MTSLFEAKLLAEFRPGITYKLESICRGKGRCQCSASHVRRPFLSRTHPSADNFTKRFDMKILAKDGKVMATGTSEQVDIPAQRLTSYKNPYDGP